MYPEESLGHESAAADPFWTTYQLQLFGSGMSAGGQTQGYNTNILPRARYSPCSKGSLWGEWLSSANWRQYRKDPLDLL